MSSFKWCFFVLSFCISYMGFNPMILATAEEAEFTNHLIKKSYMNFKKSYYGPFAGLPNDIVIHHIIPFLYHSEISSLQQTCKGLHASLKDSNPVWKRLYICLKAKGPLDFEEAVRDWKALYQATSTLERRLKRLSWRVESAMYNIETALCDKHPFTEYVRGLIAEMQLEKYKSRDTEHSVIHPSLPLQHYQRAFAGGYKSAQKRYIFAIYAGNLGVESKSIEERRSMLEQLALQGYRYAQKLLDYAHFFQSSLKYTKDDQAGYFETLQHRAQKNDIDAQRAKKWLTQAIALGKVVYASMTEEKRFQYLLELEAQGDTEARSCINRALYSGTLGQGQRDEQERFEALVQRASAGDEDARSWVYRAIYKGTLAQDEVGEEERFEILLEEANEGNILAQQYVNHANYYGDLGRNNISETERYNILVQREQQGDQDALQFIDNAFYYGKLSCETMTEEERLQKLILRAVEGNRQAQLNIWSVLDDGELGQQKDTEKALITAYGFFLLNAITGNRG